MEASDILSRRIAFLCRLELLRELHPEGGEPGLDLLLGNTTTPQPEGQGVIRIGEECYGTLTK